MRNRSTIAAVDLCKIAHVALTTTRARRRSVLTEPDRRLPAPDRPIAKGLASPALLAHVLTAKYCDHLPLYRQSQIFARHGVELDRSTLANWVGGAVWWLESLHARLAE